MNVLVVFFFAFYFLYWWDVYAITIGECRIECIFVILTVEAIGYDLGLVDLGLDLLEEDVR